MKMDIFIITITTNLTMMMMMKLRALQRIRMCRCDMRAGHDMNENTLQEEHNLLCDM